MTEQLEQRKQDLKNRISTLSEELKPLLKRVESLRERISFLESDLRDVLDQQRDASKSQKKVNVR